MDIQQRMQALFPSTSGNKGLQIPEGFLEKIKLFSNDIANTYFGEHGLHLKENTSFDVFAFAPEQISSTGPSISQEPIVIKDLATILLERSGHKSPEEILNQIKEALSEKKLAFAFKVKYTEDEKAQLVVPEDHKEVFQNRDVETHEIDEKTGMVNKTVLQSDQLNVTTLNEQQYAKITGVALQRLDTLSETLRAYNEQIKKGEEAGDYSLSERMVTRQKGQNDAVKQLFKGLAALNLSQRRKVDARQKELKQIEAERQEKRIEKERRIKKQEKFTKKVHSDIEKDQKKSERLEDFKKGKTGF